MEYGLLETLCLKIGSGKQVLYFTDEQIRWHLSLMSIKTFIYHWHLMPYLSQSCVRQKLRELNDKQPIEFLDLKLGEQLSKHTKQETEFISDAVFQIQKRKTQMKCNDCKNKFAYDYTIPNNEWQRIFNQPARELNLSEKNSHSAVGSGILCLVCMHKRANQAGFTPHVRITADSPTEDFCKTCGTQFNRKRITNERLSQLQTNTG